MLRVAMIRALCEQLGFADEPLARNDPCALPDADSAFDTHGPFRGGGALPSPTEI